MEEVSALASLQIEGGDMSVVARLAMCLMSALGLIGCNIQLANEVWAVFNNLTVETRWVAVLPFSLD